ncbi:MAG: NAD(P)H-dependent oxidoreductase, partial [Clostridia bacterium]|nr:NAD(P)H-dependent oxidoreductase [Clostridia bacterium]
MILFVNACVRQASRTKRLAKGLLKKAGRPYEEADLTKIRFPKVDEDYLLLREKLVTAGDLRHPALSLSVQFARADEIVIAAPYWDLSFPALLKQYFEQICVVGITFRYTQDGRPEGLCRARKLTYVTTAGGTAVPEEYGFGYVRALAENFYGIP